MVDFKQHREGRHNGLPLLSVKSQHTRSEIHVKSDQNPFAPLPDDSKVVSHAPPPQALIDNHRRDLREGDESV